MTGRLTLREEGYFNSDTKLNFISYSLSLRWLIARTIKWVRVNDVVEELSITKIRGFSSNPTVTQDNWNHGIAN